MAVEEYFAFTAKKNNAYKFWFSKSNELIFIHKSSLNSTVRNPCLLSFTPLF
jgi:hypothetical protein